MKKLVQIIALFALLFSCDDGDIIVISFDFDDATLENCGEEGDYVFFKINSGAQESISLSLGTTQTLFIESGTIEYTLNETSNFVNYRKYEGAIASDYFCSSVPPTTPLVAVDYLGVSGTAVLVTETTLDDNDGLEEVADFTIDTDGDELPDFYDFDDDGDNVPTAAEIGDDPSAPQDTDGDGVADYLDDDDDGDGILTRNEDLDGNLNPTNDISDPMVGPNYLNPAITAENIINEYIAHTYGLSSDIRLQIEDLVLINNEEQITQELLDFGEKTDVLTASVTITPVFD